MATSSQRRRAVAAWRVVSLAGACGVLGIGIAAAAVGLGGVPAVDPRPALPGTMPVGNTTPAVLRTQVGVLALATVIGFSGGRVSQPGRFEPADPSEPELAPRSGNAGTASLSGETASAWPVALLRPSGGTVSSRFGWRTHPIFGSPEFHTGIDIATRYGSPVVAARAGVVLLVGWKSGYGRIVALDHGGGLETMYSHLSASLVAPGQEVEEGEEIGLIGSTGWSTGPHLFFEVRRNGVPLDPARYLK